MGMLEGVLPDLACADCRADLSLGYPPSLEADVKAGRRKVLCGSCLPGGPAVVTVIEGPPPVDVGEVLAGIAAEPEPDETPPPSMVQGVTLREACRIDEIAFGSTRYEMEAARKPRNVTGSGECQKVGGNCRTARVMA